jgi:hypothetical protein
VNNPHDELVQHCLSRGFKDGDRFSGHKFRPEAMERLWRQKTYDKFFLYLELGPHNGIQKGIQGDFMTFTAPYGKFLMTEGSDETTHVRNRSPFLPSPYADRSTVVAVAAG